ncbi:MAG TPA: molybdate ABC transporter substrate-binding protein [Alcaligenes sp.]|nr:molybdate ABC transporter substrate-binding protein [Alcaligenes sp.]HRL26564.1 molybdate ABC transporter substrate-binding protein [Alcaligenes sp.]
MKSLLLSAACLLAATLPVQASDLLLATGAGYRKPVTELLQTFQKETGLTAESSFGNMQQVRAQSEQNPEIAAIIGDRFFLEPMGIAERFVNIGQGALMLAVPKGKAIVSIQDLKEPAYQRIALGDAKKTVYGRAATTCLQREGVPAQGRTVEVAMLPQVSSYLLTGEVDAGFINRSEALAHKDKLGTIVPMPASCYDPIDLSLAVLKGRQETPALRAWTQFLGSESAKAILARHGL